MNLSKKEIVLQSKSALAQWKDQWIEHSKEHSKCEMKNMADLVNIGVGRSLVLAANGYSLERNIETLKKMQENCDIMACDKSLHNLLKHGIKPKFCTVADANVSYEDYLEPWKDQLDETILLMNVCGNPKWTKNGNWADKFFYVNQDAIKSEELFGKMSGCPNQIPAGTNVSNAMVILACQSTNNKRQNWMGYDKIILLGFDYCWRDDGNYYAFNEDGGGKRNYMKHVYCLDVSNKYVHSSQNLMFSARWLSDYIRTFRLPVVNCSDDSLLIGVPHKKLESQLPYEYKPEDKEKVNTLIKKMSQYNSEMGRIKKELASIGKDHWAQFMKSI